TPSRRGSELFKLFFRDPLGEKQSHQPEDEDQRLGRKLLQAAEKEDAISDGSASRADSPQHASTSPNVSRVVSRKRPATPIGKLLDELAEQNASSDRFHDVWARTLKEIVDLGPEAVPELIAELDATSNDMMLRCLGFTLRAIDDKRAVPALIRAIPKTLLPPGSDMGLRAEEESLAKFMQQYDLDDRDEGMRYGFGRPVREICGALTKLTGQSFGEEQIYSVFAGGNAIQQQLKEQLFRRIAKNWADWWEQHWSDYLEDTAYSRVNLPESQSVAAVPLLIHQQRRFKIGDASSGWILGSFADPKTKDAFYDLDTGRAAGLPNKWRQTKDIKSHLEEIEAWAAREGFDLMGTEYVSPEDNDRRFYALRPIGLQAWELGEHRWKMSSADITFEALRAEGAAAAGLLLHFDRKKATFDPEKTATFLFKTREGTPGLLFVGVEVQDDSLKPGGVSSGDDELEPIAFFKGRRFGWAALEESPRKPNP
ncbi:MAG: hypothetical protein WD894_14895, partial [Pirellulales bacterium]